MTTRPNTRLSIRPTTRLTARLTTRRTREAFQLAAAASLAALCLLTTACTATDDGGKPGGESVSEEGKKADQALEHRTCLREHGLDVPEPKPGEQGVGIKGDSVSKEALEKALKACKGKGGADMGGGMTQAQKDKMIKHAQCMRKNGIDMPDPTFGDDGSASGTAPKNMDENKFAKAMKACESVAR
ncbi:hypothetical protein L1085_032035 [Streptomyces sp. MSC1_001]|jgi:hypothetical protein|uniref:hypothetical protein n=1 Tax=Streptomyces sp. MSC1_001 TaxID=2909263 RepID=UPI00202FB1BB|nr:hypothetical protein [Streptomyces sp. MSC1_001]